MNKGYIVDAAFVEVSREKQVRLLSVLLGTI